MNDIANKTALITAVDSAFGYGIANVLASKKCNIIVVGKNENDTVQISKYITDNFNVRVHFFISDLTSVDAAENIYSFCKNSDLTVDILINNSYPVFKRTFANTDLNELYDIYYSNIYTPTFLCHFFGKDMAVRKSGNILMLSSLTAFSANPLTGFYGASKSYIRNFSKAFRIEMKDCGVNVTCAFVCDESNTGVYNNIEDFKYNFDSEIQSSIGKSVMNLIDAMLRNKKSVFESFKCKLFSSLYYLMPNFVFRLCYQKGQKINRDGKKNKIISGKALITGASSGIGYNYASTLAAKKVDVIIASNESDKLQKAAIDISKQYNVRSTAIFIDLAQKDSAEILTEKCKYENIDVVINNAGMFIFDSVINTSTSKIGKILNLHVLTPTILCKLFSEKMEINNGGYILNMSSLAAWIPYPGIALYASTKRYLKNLSGALHNEMYCKNIIFSTICPGAVATDLYNLSANYQNLAVKLGIMMKPLTLSKKAICKLVNGKSVYIPGVINRIFLPIILLIPENGIIVLKRWLFKKFKIK